MATEKWEKFFKDAGIPSGPAKKYAVNFRDNRMTLSMLSDLNKEILQDLGVTLVGDILAILRFSKEITRQLRREQEEDFDVEDKKMKVSKQVPKIHREKAIVVDKVKVNEVSAAQGNKDSNKLEKKLTEGRKTLSDRFSEQFEPPIPTKKPREVREVATDTEINVKKDVQPSGSTQNLKTTTVIPAVGKAVSGSQPDVFKRLESPLDDKEIEGKSKQVAQLGNLKPLKAATGAKKNVSKSSSIFSRLGERSAIPTPTNKQEINSNRLAQNQQKSTMNKETPKKVLPTGTASGVFKRLGIKELSESTEPITRSEQYETYTARRYEKQKPTEKVKPWMRAPVMDRKTQEESSVFSRLGKK